MKHHYKHIDSLRGIAVLFVIWLHVSEKYINLSTTLKENGSWLYDIALYLNFGRIGVVIFFAISGFVLLKSINGVKEFIIKRFFRLYPLFWLSVILGIYIIYLFGGAVSFDKVVANLTMLPLMFNQDMVLGLYWTLEAELFFYFIGLLLFIFKASNKPINLFLISIVFLVFFVIDKKFNLLNPEHTGFIVLPLNLAIMFWGALYRYIYDNPNISINIFNKEIKVKLLFIILTISIIILPLMIFFKGVIDMNFRYTKFGISYILGISIFILLSTKFKIYNRILVWIGTISYSLYLFHPIVFNYLFWWLQNYAPKEFKEFDLSIYLIINLILSIILASLSYYLIEKPSIKYSYYLINQKSKKD